MAMGKHYGSFAKGFSDSLIAMMRMSMMMEYYKSREDYMVAHANYWNSRGMGKGMDPGTRAAYWAGGEGYGSGVDQETPKAGKVSMPEMVKMAEKAGFKGDDAAHIAALAQAESGGNPGAVGKAGEIGLTQINPHAWPTDMVNAARDPQGAFNAAYTVFKKQGWGAWSTDPSSPNFTPGNNGMRFFKAAQSSLGAAPKTEPAVVKSEVDAGKPTRTATAEEATTAAPEGGFRLPGDKGTPYQVAGDAGAVSEAGAERAKEDLERHRASSGDDTDTFTHGALDPAQARTYGGELGGPRTASFPAPRCMYHRPARTIQAPNRAAAAGNDPGRGPST